MNIDFQLLAIFVLFFGYIIYLLSVISKLEKKVESITKMYEFQKRQATLWYDVYNKERIKNE